MFILTLSSSVIFAQKMPFQGKLIKGNSNVSGTKDLKFTLTYDSATKQKNWTETLKGVQIKDGYYSVVLGNEKPIPAEIYDFKKEAKLVITVDSENLSPITLYAPIVSSNTEYIKMRNSSGQNKVVLSGNDERSSLILYSENKQHAYLGTKKEGGFFRLSSKLTPIKNISNIDMQATSGNSWLLLKAKEKDNEKTKSLVSIYAYGDEQDAETKDGWKRAGVDLFNNTSGRNLVRLATGRGEKGKDDNGEYGKLIMHGTSTPILEITGKKWEDSDLGHINIYGKSKNNDWAWANIELTTILVGQGESKGTNGKSGGFLELLNTQNGTNDATSRLPKVQLSSFHHNTNEGKKDAGYLTIMGADKKENFYLGSDNGGNNGRLDIHGANGATKAGIGSDNNSGYFFLNNTKNTETIKLNGSNGTGTFTGAITAPNITQTSDRRLKKNIRPLTNSLANIKNLQGVNFHWKKDKTKTENMGFIAQEVEKVYPELVLTNEKGTKSVAYANLVAALVESIKEMDAKITQLESKNEQLKAQVDELDTLKKDVNYLMKMVRRSTHASGK